MSQRVSGYKRKKNDLYETPNWATEALIPYLPLRVHNVWEPSCGNGKIVDVLESAGYKVLGTDLARGCDFLDRSRAAYGNYDAIITNPPYKKAQEFIEHALWMMEIQKGCVAMLLRHDFDSARSRRHLFADCPQWARKIVLTRRIVWFERKDGKKAAPSYNHAWYLWDWKHKGPATIAYHYDEQPGIDTTPDSPCQLRTWQTTI